MANTAENVREFYRRQGEEREQARIVELLEKAQNQTVHVIDPTIFKSKQIKIICNTIRSDLLIALIKGENK